jgi:hypothetical protein
MNEIALRCHGFSDNGVVIPPFVLRRGELVCVHLSKALGHEQESRVLEILSGGTVSVEASVASAPAKVPSYGRWKSLTCGRETCVDCLVKSSGTSREDASVQLRRLGIEPSWRVVSVAQGPRLILGLLATQPKADAVVFADGGLDPVNRQRVLSVVGDWLSAGKAAVVVHYPVYRGVAAVSEESHSVGNLGRCVAPNGPPENKGLRHRHPWAQAVIETGRSLPRPQHDAAMFALSGGGQRVDRSLALSHSGGRLAVAHEPGYLKTTRTQQLKLPPRTRSGWKAGA